MTKKSKTIIFFGNERLATGTGTDAPTLQALIGAGYNVGAIVSSFEQSKSRSPRDLEVTHVAKAHNIPLLLPSKLSEIKDQISLHQADAGILVAYGKIVPESIINMFPRGIVNVHPSLLPRHRGPTPIESVILQGDNNTGVSIMQLVKKMDAGPLYAQSMLDLRGDEAKQELTDKLLDMGCSLLLKTLPGILNGSAQKWPQNDSQATYDNLITKEDGVINWDKSAKVLEREIRAYVGWPKSKATIGNVDTIITKAHVLNASGPAGQLEPSNKKLIVYCGDGALGIDTLKPAGKQEMSSQAFLAGYKSLLKKFAG